MIAEEQPKSGPLPENGSKRSGALQRFIKLLGPFIGLIVVIALFGLSPESRSTFLTMDNADLVIGQTVIVGLGALGMTMIIIAGGIDLSVGSAVALTGTLAATWLVAGASPIVACLGALLAGALLGAFNGTAITWLRVTPFIVTLGTLGIARGVAQWIGHESQVFVQKHSWIENLTVKLSTLATDDATAQHRPPTWFETHVILNTPLGGLSQSVFLLVGLAILVHLILRHTVFGRSLFAIGSNETAARLSGLRVDAIKIAVYTLAGVFFGLSGLIQFSKLGGEGDSTGNVGEELDVIAGVVIGGGSLNGGEGSVLGSMIGVLIMTLLRNGAVLMGWPAYVQQIIIGAVIVVAVALDRFRHAQAARA